MFDIGGTFNKDGVKKNILGLSGGWQNKYTYAKIWDYGEHIDNVRKNNLAFGSVFWRILIGRRSNLDITNRLLVGYLVNGDYTASLLQGDIPWRADFDRRLNLTYSLGIGWTFLRTKSTPENDTTAINNTRRDRGNSNGSRRNSRRSSRR